MCVCRCRLSTTGGTPSGLTVDLVLALRHRRWKLPGGSRTEFFQLEACEAREDTVRPLLQVRLKECRHLAVRNRFPE